MPNEATVEDIQDAYMLSWKLGLKANALYRDGCKLSQPLSTRSKDGEVEDSRAGALAGEGETAEAGVSSSALTNASNANAIAGDRSLTGGAPALPEPVSPREARILHINEPIRRPLPRKRHGYTVEGRVGGHKLYLRTGEYSDGSLGEIFVDLHKEGAAFRSLMNCFAIAVSKGLQYGVPLEEFVDTFIFTKFEPSGVVDHPNIKMANSVIDYIFRVLGMEYLKRLDFVQVPPIDAVPEDEGATDGSAAHSSGDKGAGTGPAPASNDGAEGAGPRARPESGGIKPRAQKTKASSNANGDHSHNGNGHPASNGNGHPASNGNGQYADESPGGAGVPARDEAGTNARPTVEIHDAGTLTAAALDEQLQSLMGDAPFCDLCGHVTVRNGSCYKCLNCGHSQGCS
jgi:ribonucleoside-diphosphate reductase alpha chain